MRKEEEKKKMAHYSALTDGLPVSSKITSESTVKTQKAAKEVQQQARLMTTESNFHDTDKI